MGTSKAADELVANGVTDVTVPIKVDKAVFTKLSEESLIELTQVPKWPEGLDKGSFAAAKAELAKRWRISTKRSGNTKLASTGTGTKASEDGTTNVGDASGTVKSKSYGEGAKDKDDPDKKKMMSSERGPQLAVVNKKALLNEGKGYGAMKEKGVAVGKYGVAEGTLRLLHADARSGGKVMLGPNMVTLKGEVQGSAVLAEGLLKLRTPPKDFGFLGEQLGFQAGLEGNAGVGAWAKATGTVDIRTRKAEAGLGASAEAFAGAKAGGKVFMGMHWNKKAPAVYYGGLVKWLKSKVSSRGGFVGKAIGWLTSKAAPALQKAGDAIFGPAGRSNLLRLSAGGEVSAGIGGAASIECNIGRSFAWSGKLKGTLGVGLGGTLSAQVGYVDAALLSLILGKRAVGELWPKLKRHLANRLDAIKHGAAAWVRKAITNALKVVSVESA